MCESSRLPTPAPPAPIAPVFGVLPGISSPGNALKEAPAGVKGPAYESVPEISGSAGPNAKVLIDVVSTVMYGGPQPTFTT